VVLEALHIGAGGSGLNGGQVIPGVKHDYQSRMSSFTARLA